MEWESSSEFPFVALLTMLAQKLTANWGQRIIRNTCSVLGSVLRASYMLPHLILTRILWGKDTCHGWGNRGTQLQTEEMRVEPKQGAPESMLLLFLFLAVPCGMCPVRFDLPHNNILMRGRRWHPTPVLLPGKSWTEEPGRLQSMGSLELDTTERLHFHFPLSCIGEGNGNPLQCSSLENPRDRGAWWAAVTKSQTRLSDFPFPFPLWHVGS